RCEATPLELGERFVGLLDGGVISAGVPVAVGHVIGPLHQWVRASADDQQLDPQRPELADRGDEVNLDGLSLESGLADLELGVLPRSEAESFAVVRRGRAQVLDPHVDVDTPRVPRDEPLSIGPLLHELLLADQSACSVGAITSSSMSTCWGCASANATPRAMSWGDRAFTWASSRRPSSVPLTSGVSTIPGSISVTRSPEPATSLRSARPRPTSAHLLAM